MTWSLLLVYFIYSLQVKFKKSNWSFLCEIVLFVQINWGCIVKLRTCRFYFLLVVAVSIAGCSFAPDYERPAMELPPAWENAAADNLEAQWWRRFNDPVLNALVQEALANNKDIAAAVARLEIARSGVGSSASRLAPSPSASARHDHSWASRRVDGPPPAGHEESTNSSILFNAIWELDFWGKYRNTVKSSQAFFLAQESSRDAVYLSIAALTTKAYFDILSNRYQIDIARQTLKQRESAVRLYSAGASVGYMSEADLMRARSEVEVARYSLNLSLMQLDEAHSRLQLLLGRSPAEVMQGAQDTGASSLTSIGANNILPSGLPVDLLERRPDIKAAEQDLRAANFDIGVVRANYFPSITLGGSAGYSAKLAKFLTIGGSGVWNYGGELNLPLDFWQTRFQEKMAEARAVELAAAYEQTVRLAFKDMRDSLARQKYLADASASMLRRVDYLKKAASQAKTRYESGYSGYLELLDAERALFDSRLMWAQSRTAQLYALVDVCMALGGGWSDHDLPERLLAPVAEPNRGGK